MHVLNDGYSLETIQLADHTSSLKEMKEYIAEEVKIVKSKKDNGYAQEDGITISLQM